MTEIRGNAVTQQVPVWIRGLDLEIERRCRREGRRRQNVAYAQWSGRAVTVNIEDVGVWWIIIDPENELILRDRQQRRKVRPCRSAQAEDLHGERIRAIDAARPPHHQECRPPSGRQERIFRRNFVAVVARDWRDGERLIESGDGIEMRRVPGIRQRGRRRTVRDIDAIMRRAERPEIVEISEDIERASKRRVRRVEIRRIYVGGIRISKGVDRCRRHVTDAHKHRLTHRQRGEIDTDDVAIRRDVRRAACGVHGDSRGIGRQAGKCRGARRR